MAWSYIINNHKKIQKALETNMLALLFYLLVIVCETFGGSLHLHLKCKDIYSHSNWPMLDFKSNNCGRSPVDDPARGGQRPSDDTPETRSSWLDDDDDDIAPRIMRGVDASEHEFPWMAQIIYLNDSEPACGGTLINKRYVLTAANCITRFDETDGSVIKEQVNDISIRLGAHYVANDCRESGCPELLQVEVEEIVPHGNLSKLDNIVLDDIALIRLKNDVVFQKGKISPVCLPRCKMLNRDFYGVEMTTIGFGYKFTVPQLENPTTLQMTFPIVAHYCRIGYYKPQTMICTSVKNKGTCNGDSGSPLMYRENSVLYQLGIESFGASCDKRHNINQDAVFTRVAPYMRWILDNIRE